MEHINEKEQKKNEIEHMMRIDSDNDKDALLRTLQIHQKAKAQWEADVNDTSLPEYIRLRSSRNIADEQEWIEVLTEVLDSKG